MDKPDAKEFRQKASTHPDGDAPEPGYEAWVIAKIEAALQEADQFPEQRTPIDQVWKKFRLDD